MNNAEYQLATDAVRCVFDRAAVNYDSAAVVQREIGARLLERLDYLRIEPQLILDLGTGTGAALDTLRSRYPAATVLGLDLSVGMLQCASKRGRWFRRPKLVAADAAALPLPDASVDLIYSNLMLPWCSDPESVWGEIGRVLRPGGALLFTTFGPDTLMELKRAAAEVDAQYPHVHAFTDMHDIGDALLRHGVIDAVMDAENIRVEYPSLDALVTELRRTGSVNINAGRRRSLGRKLSLAALDKHYPGDRTDRRVTATIELVYGHGWAGESSASSRAGGEVFVPLSSLHRNASSNKQ